MTIRVIIVDDSPTMRAILMSRLAKEPDIEVVAAAANAAEGRQVIRELDPDVVTLDVEMPGMNGLDFLEKIMQLRPTPVIIVSGATQKGAETTARALALGAVDCYAKSDNSTGLPMDDNGKLAQMIREASKVTFHARPAASATPAAAAAQRQSVQRITTEARGSLRERPRVIAIGSSTGGVEALQTLLGAFPENCPPTLVVQHINARFAPAVARTLDGSCPPKIVVAEPDMPLKDGHVYIAPGDDRHLLLGGANALLTTKLRKGEPVSGHLPSVDVLFGSVAELVGPQAVGILLTGMGSDGARGLLAMSQKGAHTIAQDEATCTVFGMPRAAISLGAAGVVAPIGHIARHALSKAA
ncbi:chemotaxis-specific protein-glutamate methyltransferase CheB [Novosphingobium olei]|uniref:Protein-glutamate methylesterase/protein-glutamine glutaminase n=1 Tax=Novosphingobium olei TaxID=2728851 RepID=A0A7Y0BM63_9SPHN|nr:chemotaxis-specific protein-glutamate methyltransferase CheB [Novosphingobium olei]NML92927.1 chemotaxis-specific protein-glutamate methyltransferase CheB [Novosphingobium olei]BEU99496.1 chemotaxis-specific protein-glutamate methyltransferase CheB [Novosphingobium olei]